MRGCVPIWRSVSAAAQEVALVLQTPVSLAGEVLLDIERHPPGAFSRLGGWMREHLGGGALSPLSAAAVAVALLAWVQLADPEATELPTSGLGSGMSASGKPGPPNRYRLMRPLHRDME